MGGPFFMRGASALAGDLALLFRRHRSKTTSFFAHSVHSTPPGHSEPESDRHWQPMPPTRGSRAAGLHGGCQRGRKMLEIKLFDSRALHERPRVGLW
jgi:hypothetical protein